MNWPRRRDAEDVVGVVFVGILLALLCVTMLLLVTRIRAQPAVIACRARGLDGLHPPFSAEVTCAPRVGQAIDTLYVKTEAR